MVKDMKNFSLNDIIEFAEKSTDDELEKEYYDSVYESLGSECEDMYELGYDIADIVEREKYEKYLRQRTDLLEYLCVQRDIKLWYRSDEEWKLIY